MAEFLDDERVIDLPLVVRKILLYGFILPFRPKKSAKAYSEIFDPKRGSPLLFHSEDLCEKLQVNLGSDFIVALGMRYGKPALGEALKNLIHAGCEEIIALPLFPQYSSAVNGSALAALFNELKKYDSIPSVKTLSEFYDKEEFIDCQARLIADKLQHHSKVIFSYHSLPVRQPSAASYREKCVATSKMLAKKLGLTENDYRVAFQSQLGRAKWIGPDFNWVLKELQQEGVKDIVVSCPSFIIDCLETLEEIGIRGKNDWHNMTGGQLQLVPSLNSNQDWVSALGTWVHAMASRSKAAAAC